MATPIVSRASAKSLMLMILIALLLILLVGFGPAIYRAAVSRTWPSTAGRVMNTSIDSSSVGGISDSVDRWQANVSCTFSAGGKSYTGTRYTSTGEFYSGSKEECDRFLVDHPVGSPVQVFFDPNDPANCVLKPGLDYRHIFLSALMLMTIVGILGVWKGWIRTKFSTDEPKGPTLRPTVS
jgi:hypothetical protein